MNSFASPAAFRQALEARLRQDPGREIGRLRKRLAMERLLVRLQEGPRSTWVLKGGVALELRLRDRARSTVDLDLGLRVELETGHSVMDSIHDHLADAFSRRSDDYFDFSFFGAADPDLKIEGLNAYRFSINANLAGRLFDRFRLDVVVEPEESLPSETISGSGFLVFAGVPRESFRALTLARHFAEKIHAYTRPRETKTRVKDLVDIFLIVQLDLLDLRDARRDLTSVFATRQTHGIPTDLPAPPPEWKDSFEAEAKRTGMGLISLDHAEKILDSTWAQLWEQKEK